MALFGRADRSRVSLRPATPAARLPVVTQSSDSSPKPAARTAAKPAPAAKPAAPARPAAPASKAAAVSKAAKPSTPAKSKAVAIKSKAEKARPGHHPNLGLAPIDLTAGYPAAAEKLRDNASRISAAALEAAAEADPTIRTRYDQVGLRRLLRDGELLVARLATCLASGEDGLLVEYAEWIGPICRRRGVPLGDMSALCAGIRGALEPDLTADEFAAAGRALDAAAARFKRNGRLAGDGHKRNSLLKWMYRGV